ncbi:MAG: glycosyltransferase [Acidobacteriaceae bacterium]|jgi:glycosyltransferase involved in cell wall biosynthesis|nr:glycosyltransferase [Acidobacteriaceae bacterium]
MAHEPLSAGERVTPVVLTFNEQPNIARCLDSLRWAQRVVVLDSGSTDETESIARAYPNVSWYTRAFDRHGAQWEFAIRSTGITTQYVLALDADYSVSTPFLEELEQRFLPGQFAGGIAGFDYRLLGRSLLGSIYPAKPVLFAPAQLTIAQPGHTQEMHVDGAMYRFTNRLILEDRKSPDRFVRSQIEYARLERDRLRRGTNLRWQDHVRRLGLMPLIAGFAGYVRAGGPLRGKAALRYACERTLFECLLVMNIFNDTSAHDE